MHVKQEFPEEGYKIRKLFLNKVKKLNILEAPYILKNILKHSSKSNNANYEFVFKKSNILLKPQIETRTGGDLRKQSAIFNE